MPANALSSTVIPLPRTEANWYAGLEELKNLAFSLNHQHAFHTWLNLGESSQEEALLDRYILASVCHSSGKHIGQLQSVDTKAATDFANGMHGRLINLSRVFQARKIGFSQIWFEALDALSGAMLEHHYLANAQELVALAKTTGSEKFPGTAQSIALTEAYLSLLLGRIDEAEAVALKFVRRPFLMPSRLDRARLYLKILPILAKTGHIKEYREVLWRGLTGWYSKPGLREQFVDKAVAAYRGPLRALFKSGIPLNGRFIFLITLLTRWASRHPSLRLLGIHGLFNRTLQTQLYIQNYLSSHRPYLTKDWRDLKLASLLRPAKGKILVTRAMGGMGDVLMMVPGLLALKKKHPGKEIHFAIQKGFFPLFAGLSEFKCLDINTDEIDTRHYFKWYDLTDCPAARIEGREFPHVRSNRIAIFARAMGVNLKRLKKSGVVPTYRVTPEEEAAAKEAIQLLNPNGMPLIGVQPFSADTYKNWPHTEALVKDLARDAVVLVFHSESFVGYEGANIHKIILPIRRSAALAGQCSVLVAPDSSFVHLGAALGVPTVGIFGPTNGYVFGRHYQKVFKLVAPKRHDFACSPCWRNEHRPCVIADDRESVCLRHISTEDVKQAIKRPLPTKWELIKDQVRDSLWR